MRLAFEIPQTSQLTCLLGNCTSKFGVQQRDLGWKFPAYQWYLNSWMKSRGSNEIEGKTFKIRTEAWGFPVFGGQVDIAKPAKQSEREQLVKQDRKRSTRNL